jgi:DnaJ domain
MATAEVHAARDRRVDLYEVLQISPKACPEVVQAAYRALARAYHPDVNPSPDAARQMQQLNAAYGVISDPEKRTRYDTLRIRPLRARREVAPEPKPRPTYIRPVPTSVVSPLPRSGGGYRQSRVFMLLAAVAFVIGALVYGLFAVAATLDDEPTHAMVLPEPGVTQMVQDVQAPTDPSLSDRDLLNRLSTEH